MKTRTKAIHRGSAVAQSHLYPVGKQYLVSTTAQQLMADLRQAVCEFGAATAADIVVAKYAQMQQAMANLASWTSTIEKNAKQPREVVMKF